MKNATLKKFLISAVALLVLAVPMSAKAQEKDEDNTQKYYFGDVVNAGKDTGYSEKNSITIDDPHYGWKLGEFYINGFTSVRDRNSDNPIFLKTTGDNITLGFRLDQNIYRIDPNKEGKNGLAVVEDLNGYDAELGVDMTNMGRGMLLVKYIDSENKVHYPIMYDDYLHGKVRNADTAIQACEEGDYEVVLDYELKKESEKKFLRKINPAYTCYSIRFKFSVRNGNCMAFPRDIKTDEELSNTSITENGFYLDLAKSKYLDINVKKEVLEEGAKGLIEDTRFNRPAKDGDKYTEEGVYTITVKNEYTGSETEKVIYVGTNSILKAYVKTGMDIDEIQKKVAQGARIDENGSITESTIQRKGTRIQEQSNSEPRTNISFL